MKIISPTIPEKIPDDKRVVNFLNLENLYDQYAPALLGIVETKILNKQKSLDVLQLVYQELWDQIDEFDTHKFRFFTWLYQLTCTIVTVYNKTIATTVVKTTSVKMHQVTSPDMLSNQGVGYAG